MVKWFCDVCEKEIEAPEAPRYVRAYECLKSREDADEGYGPDDTIIKVMAHHACAEWLQNELRAALARTKQLVKNNL
jgi:hypothetical protein